jgi:hypothetical protein
MRSALEMPGSRALLTVLASAALLGAILLLPAAGEAHKTGPPEDCEWTWEINAEGWGDSCFEPDGDKHWVRDQTPNHWSVRIQIQTDYGKIRWCANTHGADSWHSCNFDHREDTCVRWRMFEQSDRVPIPLDNTRKWTDWSAWENTSTGSLDSSCYNRHLPPGVPPPGETEIPPA